MPKDSPRTIRIIDLFAGCGGFTLGFTGYNQVAGRNVFDVVWANDFDEDAAATYNRNFGDHCIHGDIVDILEDPHTEIPHADLVIGGPPCQGFSLLNKNRDGDPRKELWRPFMEVVERSGAKAFVMENVQQLLSSGEYNDIAAAAQELGFKQPVGVKLCAADYGVPQERYRAFVLAVKDGDPEDVFPPVRTHYNDRDEQLNAFERRGRLKWNTVEDAIADLPPEPDGTEIRADTPPLDLHFGRNPTEKSKKRYRAIPEQGMNRFDLQERAPDITPACWKRKKSGGTDLFGRLWWDRPCVTIRTEFFKPEKGRYLHPVEHRPITHREAARIQSFPDTFIFMGSKIEVARQIGNAVPPLLGIAIARSVAEHFGVDTVDMPVPEYKDWISSNIDLPRSGRHYDAGAAKPHHVEGSGKEHDPRKEGAEHAPQDGVSLQVA